MPALSGAASLIESGLQIQTLMLAMEPSKDFLGSCLEGTSERLRSAVVLDGQYHTEPI